jgi:hypothetical protein
MVGISQVRLDTPHDDIVGILKRDGAVVITDVFSRAKRDAIEAELKPYLARPEAMHTPNEMYAALELDEAFLPRIPSAPSASSRSRRRFANR